MHQLYNVWRDYGPMATNIVADVNLQQCSETRTQVKLGYFSMQSDYIAVMQNCKSVGPHNYCKGHPSRTAQLHDVLRDHRIVLYNADARQANNEKMLLLNLLHLKPKARCFHAAWTKAFEAAFVKKKLDRLRIYEKPTHANYMSHSDIWVVGENYNQSVLLSQRSQPFQHRGSNARSEATINYNLRSGPHPSEPPINKRRRVA